MLPVCTFELDHRFASSDTMVELFDVSAPASPAAPVSAAPPERVVDEITVGQRFCIRLPGVHH